MFDQEFHKSKLLLDRAHSFCLEHIKPVTEPLALISQIQRSGGSMLSQLFDVHPEVHAHPHELKFGHPKKYITAFTPRLANLPENMKSFFEIYPDGRQISVIRDAKNWYPSASRHISKKYQDIRLALSQWNDNAQGMLRNKQQYGDLVCIILFEDLIRSTEAVMRYLADFLGIGFDDILLTPTFNKTPVKPNTSFNLEKPGIMFSALERHKNLSRAESRLVDEITRETYEEIKGLAISIR
jgi:hypothetical protein